MDLSLSVNELVRAVKKAAVEAVSAQKPMSMYLGEVISEQPLKIRIDQKLTLTTSQLILPKSLSNYKIEYKDGEKIKEYTVLNSLKKNDKVILLRCDGGQKFIVIDRTEV